MTNGFFTVDQIRRASQCWGSPWRVAEREADTRMVARQLGGVAIEFPVALEHAMPKRLARLNPVEMQHLALGQKVRVGKDVFG